MAKDVTKPPVVMLANGHAPFDTRIFMKEALSLSGEGYQVSILLPTKQNDERDGIKIIATPQVVKGWQKLLVTPLHIFAAARKMPRDAIFQIHDSNILGVGVLLKILGRRVIYDAHEDTPLQIAYQHWMPTLIKIPYRWFYLLLEKLCGVIFDRIIVAEPVIARYFPKRKTFLVRNFPIAQTFKRPDVKPYAQRARRMVSAGTLTKVRGLMETMEATQLANQRESIEFVMGGKFSPPTLEQEVKKYNHSTFLGWLSLEQLTDQLFDARIGIIIPHPLERYKTNYPVKLFEFMGAGIPVIASREGELASFVTEGQCGILVDPLNTTEIADAIVWLLQNVEEAEAMGKRGQQLIFDKYNWENEAIVLGDVFKQVSLS